jgi:hypothetical protein
MPLSPIDETPRRDVKSLPEEKPFAWQFVESIGPSRACGYADDVDPWDDVVSVFEIGSRALSATDTDGTTKLLSRVLSSGVTIAVGVGAPAAVDYQPGDDGNSPPELAVAAHVVCTR